MKKGIFLVSILLVPSIIYLLFSLGQHNMAKLGYYGEFDQLDEMGDSLVFPVNVPALNVANIDDFGEDDLKDRVVLMHLFQWPCDDQCIDNIATLNNYLNRVGLNEEWTLLSICRDSISQKELEDLSVKNMYKGGNWHFATSPNHRELVDALFIRTQRASSISDIVSTEVVLLDQSKRVRGFFDLRFQQDNKLMQDAIKVLIQEPHVKWKNKEKR
ncbi:MAG TPA: hypothetical protein DCX14_10085 [Flavobacteriales bacterium]|jgi:hypothetical protein|nr:hypothetical protein [Flavobacteriales bacterium]HAW20521.1 hypothetical protein [Flavobacteriales bacterium]